jgi:type IV pilus assembly protein PilN
MKIALNLASRPYSDLGPAIQRLRTGIIALAILCVCLGVGLHLIHNKAEQARAREHSLDGQLAAVKSERQSYTALMQRPENQKLLTQSAALNQIIDDKTFSWTLAMENLETVLPAGVQATALEPIRDKDGHITLHLRVVGPQNLSIDLVRNLEHSRRFILPRIVGENAEDSSTGGANQRLEPVSTSNRFDFDILADYNPPTPDERKPSPKSQKKAGDNSAALQSSSGAANRLQRLPQRGAR